MQGNHIHVKPAVAKEFASWLEQGRVLFLSAPCGFGKTSLAKTLLAGKHALYLCADAENFALPDENGSWSILVLDNLQAIREDAEWNALCALIRSFPKRRFLLLSRGTPPGCLMAFQYTGLMSVIDADALFFDREDVRRLFRLYGVPVTDSDVGGILTESIGYPLGVAITARCMSDGKPFGPELVAQAYREVFRYFESAIYQRFDLSVRRFLLEMSPFDRFSLEMARMVSGDAHVGETLDWLLKNTTMLRCDGLDTYFFWPQFRRFLLWLMEREFSDEKRKLLFDRGGLYYELREDYPHALECYTRAGDHSRVSELLVRNAELHPGMGHYAEMEKYYRSLPEGEILASPALMQGMSMLCALATDYEGSERWYQALADFAAQHPGQDVAGKQAQSRLAWLDIALPQRSVTDMIETFPAVFRLLREKKLRLPPFSVTSTLPSLMNGGKDFSDWSKKDDLLYKTLRIPVEAVLGKDGVGLADCAIAESKFEKGEDISARMLTFLPRISEIQKNGTPDLEFAANALLAKSQLANGQSDDARRTILLLRERFAGMGQSRFFANMDALLCRIDLLTGDLDAADAWYREKAPRAPTQINVLKRYQYLTQAMVELSAGKPDAALMTLAPLEPYCTACKRHIDGIHRNLLCAIALYRKRSSGWREPLSAALREAEAYRFIRTVSGYGAAVLPLLTEIPWDEKSKWFKKLLSDTRVQAAYYPSFLRPRMEPGEMLTDTEMQVLRLLCADKSNAEIGEILDIKLTTVKTHVSHILDKLDVSRRSEAKTAAKKLWLIPGDE